ncbi:unnamed protein product [Vitrella brassicaformis CCMP3155]|uniref:Uncharacterized protein n=2 Tax=Vitrella brassicaformis TaxID=1169539 RepID=A0A0G4EDF7_VITBC|nr:unnamed protein product [Vitrella brassicaformis CCMP3155]|eukprot:CEL94033.1 unnamed protein product [Vitrella brassicaformis CCMP3155]
MEDDTGRTLDVAIRQYLEERYPQLAYSFHEAASLSDEPRPDAESVLLKRWRAVLRLQVRISELEEERDRLSEQIEQLQGAFKFRAPPDALPASGASASMVLCGHRGGITAVAFHPTYSLVFTASDDATIKVWDYESDGRLEKTLKGHTDAVNDLHFDTHGHRFASCSSDMSIRLWDSTHMECIQAMRGHDNTVSGVRFVPSGEQLVSCSRDHTLKLWDCETGYCVRTYVGHSDWVRTVDIAPDGKLFASGSNDHNIRVWSLSAPHALHELTEHDHVVEVVAFAPKPTLIQIRDAHAHGQTSKAPPSTAGGVTSTPSRMLTTDTSEGLPSDETSQTGDGGCVGSSMVLFSGSRDKTMRMWDISQQTCLYVFEGHTNWVRGICFHPSGRYVLSCSDDKTIHIYDVNSGYCVRRLDGAKGFVTCVACKHPAPLIAAGALDRELRLWACV